MYGPRKNSIFFGVNNNDLFIKLCGHITANLSIVIREYLYDEIQNMSPLINVYFDLSETDYMDSTFLGIIIGFERKFYCNLKKHLYLINASKDAMSFLENLKVHKLVGFKSKKIPEDITFKKFNTNIDNIDELKKLKIIFNSHKELSELSEENMKKFKSLQQMLEEEIERKENY